MKIDPVIEGESYKKVQKFKMSKYKKRVEKEQQSIFDRKEGKLLYPNIISSYCTSKNFNMNTYI